MDFQHTPVMLNEVLHYLQPSDGKKIIDCTFGGGSYSVALAEKGAHVLGLDVDTDAFEAFSSKDVNSTTRQNIVLSQANFDAVYDVAVKNSFVPCDGVVFDLGVSSYQLDTASRGFSFLREGPLDMRMDPKLLITAGKLLDVLDEKSLAELFFKASDELHSKKFARAIVEARAPHITREGAYWEHKSTVFFAQFIENIVEGRRDRIHPATRIFQALRMAVNDEIGSLKRGLESALDALGSGGKLVVVSFHSGEDTIVKDFFYVKQNDGMGHTIGDVILPMPDEVYRNPRSRSAKMRVFEKK